METTSWLRMQWKHLPRLKKLNECFFLKRHWLKKLSSSFIKTSHFPLADFSSDLCRGPSSCSIWPDLTNVLLCYQAETQQRRCKNLSQNWAPCDSCFCVFVNMQFIGCRENRQLCFFYRSVFFHSCVLCSPIVPSVSTNHVFSIITNINKVTYCIQVHMKVYILLNIRHYLLATNDVLYVLCSHLSFSLYCTFVGYSEVLQILFRIMW